ncbi:hypothetical protein IJ117_00115 [Candidatus Saccharibacteria bacterium]|nr:hypothetical protein [Candidatus Saccharibacteria bacterium]
MDKVLFDRVKKDHPEVIFRSGRKFLFKPPKTIVLGPDEPNSSLLLLHELGHYLSSHRDFCTQADRIRCEIEAWRVARSLCDRYKVCYDEDVVENELETYREWLDSVARCPKCRLVRVQTPDGKWHCPRCDDAAV